MPATSSASSVATSPPTPPSHLSPVPSPNRSPSRVPGDVPVYEFALHRLLQPTLFYHSTDPTPPASPTLMYRWEKTGVAFRVFAKAKRCTAIVYRFKALYERRGGRDCFVHVLSTDASVGRVAEWFPDYQWVGDGAAFHALAAPAEGSVAIYWCITPMPLAAPPIRYAKDAADNWRPRDIAFHALPA